jgi:thiamine biosynthesis lipoprotein
MTIKVFEAMGSRITAVLDGDEMVNAAELDKLPQLFEDWESALSRFRSDSEINCLPSSLGDNLRASPTLCAVLAESIRAAEYTDGLVTPLVREALQAAGYEGSFEDGIFPPATGPRIRIRIPDWRKLRSDPSLGRIGVPEEARLDLGGIAKGWAADRTATRLGRHGPALIDAGGDISVSGPRADGSPWPIGVGNPFAENNLLLTLALSAGGVATSGRDYRKWIQSGRMRHHIIDPRTGESAETDVLAATVIAPSASLAEAGAKAALILGSRDGTAWIEEHPELAGMLVLDDRRIVYSRRFSDYIWN